MRCECGKELRARVAEQKMKVGEQTFVSDIEVLRCACGETQITSAELGAFEESVASHIASAGPVSKETFRFMRKAIGLPAVELAKLLDVSAETVSRWENGVREVDRAAWALVGSLVLDEVAGRTDTRARLLQIGQAPTRTVRVELMAKRPPTLARALDLMCGPPHYTEANIAEIVGVSADVIADMFGPLAKAKLLDRGTVRDADQKVHVTWSSLVPGGYQGLIDEAILRGVDVYAPLPGSESRQRSAK